MPATEAIGKEGERKMKKMNDFGRINEIYSQYFKEPFPARSCVEVARLPKDVMIEVEAVAVK